MVLFQERGGNFIFVEVFLEDILYFDVEDEYIVFE